ncbi:MAG: TlpA family protein disulfide reductase [Planctomycetota bacterium]
MRLSSLIALTYLLAVALPGSSRNDACAKPSPDETASDGAAVEVTLRLEGKTVPGEPKVVPARKTFDALFNRTGTTPLELKKTGQNVWTCRGVEGEKYIIGWIARKGWLAKRSRMFGYCSEPFEAAKDLTVKFSPGMPATFEYDLRHPPEGVRAVPAKVMLLRETAKDGKRTFLSWGGEQKIKRPGILRISGLANRFDPNYPEIDSTVEEGDVTLEGTLYGPDKKPLARKTVRVIPLARNGFDLGLYYPESTTNSNGRFKFVGICPNQPVYVSSEGTSIMLGRQSLGENAFVSADIVLGLKTLPVVVGEPFREVLVDWRHGDVGRLSDLAGKTVVLDLWSTWCGPCIRAFPKLNQLAEEYSNIVFVALSIDYDEAAWKKMVDESDWKALKHGRLDRKKNSSVFNRPIPYLVILDENGIVRAEGNGLDIRRELDKLAKTSK